MSTLAEVQDLRLVLGAPLSAPPEAQSDHALLQATLTGDEEAFAEIVARYRHQITGYMYRLTGDYECAVDLAQETFLRVYCAAQRYRQDYAFSTYVYRIATNLAISELRRQKRRRLVSFAVFFPAKDESQNCEFEPAAEGPRQDDAIIENERRTAVANAIRSLPERYRVPLVLRDVEGKSYDEVARILQMNEGTVKSRISRGRNLLRSKLQAYM